MGVARRGNSSTEIRAAALLRVIHNQQFQGVMSDRILLRKIYCGLQDTYNSELSEWIY